MTLRLQEKDGMDVFGGTPRGDGVNNVVSEMANSNEVGNDEPVSARRRQKSEVGWQSAIRALCNWAFEGAVSHPSSRSSNSRMAVSLLLVALHEQTKKEGSRTVLQQAPPPPPPPPPIITTAPPVSVVRGIECITQN